MTVEARVAADLPCPLAAETERPRNYAMLAQAVPELDALSWWRLSGWIIVTDGCWLFDGPTRIRGYGRMGIGPRNKRVFRLAHRIVRAICVGDTTAELDHTCNVTLCVRPSHLEPVTRDENLEREVERNGWGRRDAKLEAVPM